MKYCSGCGVTKPFTDYWKNISRPDGYQSWCKLCWKTTTDKRRNGPKREVELRQRQNRHLIREYGMTIDEYESMMLLQNNVCAICARPSVKHKKLAVDHCHETNIVRGLLCENCNRGVGMFRNNVHILSKAINYLYDFEIHKRKLQN